MAPASGFDVVAQKQPAPGHAIVEVYFEGEGKTRKFEMRQVGGEWRFNAMGVPGGSDDEISGVGWP